MAVSTNTKIQIWKQITTSQPRGITTSELYQPIQKYKFESKSQQKSAWGRGPDCCINQYKNTNLKANHNWRWFTVVIYRAVSTNTKIQIWKQITTCRPRPGTALTLYQPIQKYKFESKSQHKFAFIQMDYGCINQYKNTNLKANHNLFEDELRGRLAVSTNTKIQIWKQITTKVVADG